MNERGKRPGDRPGRSDDAGEPHGVGKRSRTQAFASGGRESSGGTFQAPGSGEQTPAEPILIAHDVGPVQMSAPGDPPNDVDVQRTAARGVAGPGHALPHMETIQRSFGKHDVSGVAAHTDGEAAKAADTIGAEAYATGEHVAFAREPDVRTAAHEAAHVVQQRKGVSLLSGVGEAGDRYEAHADRVADAVVAGGSAESLLNETSPGPTGAGAVQKREEQPTAERDERHEAKVSNKLVLEAKGHVRGVDFTLSIEIERHGASAATVGKGGQEAGDTAVALKVIQPSIKMAAGECAAEAGLSMLEGNLDQTIFPGLTLGIEVHGLEASVDDGDLDLALATGVVKVEGHIPNFGRWMSNDQEAWRKLESVVDVKIVGSVEIPLPKSMLAHAVELNRLAKGFNKEIAVLDDLAQAEREMAALEAERTMLVRRMQSGGNAAREAGLARRYAQINAELNAKKSVRWAHADEVRASDVRAQKLYSKLTEEMVELDMKTGKSSIRLAIRKRIAELLESRVAKYAVKVIEAVNLLGVVLDLVEAARLIAAWGNLRFGLVGPDDEQEGGQEGPGSQSGKDDGFDQSQGDVGTPSPDPVGVEGAGDHGSGRGKGSDEIGSPSTAGGESSSREPGTGGGAQKDEGKDDVVAGVDEATVKASTSMVARALEAASNVKLSPEELRILDEMVPADLTAEELTEIADAVEAAAKDTDSKTRLGRIGEAIRELRDGVHGETVVTVDVKEDMDEPEDMTVDDGAQREEHSRSKKSKKSKKGKKGKNRKKPDRGGKQKDERYEFDIEEVHAWFTVNDEGDLVPGPKFERWKRKHIGKLKEKVGGSSYVLAEADAAASLRADYWAAGVRLTFKETGGDRVEEETFGFTVDPTTGKTTGVLDAQPIGPIEKIVHPPVEPGGMPSVSSGAVADFGDYKLFVLEATPVPSDGGDGSFTIRFRFVIQDVKKKGLGTLVDDDLRQVPIENDQQFTKTIEVTPRAARTQ